MRQINQKVKLPPGYHVDWAGEYESAKRAQARLAVIVPLTILIIFIILYTMFRSAKWALLILGVVSMAPMGGLLALSPPARTSACPRASDSSRSSASRCKPASSCSSTSTSAGREVTRSWMPPSRARFSGFVPS